MPQPERPAILSYTAIAPENGQLVNHFKLLEEALNRVVDEARGTDLDQRLVSIAATHFMEGFMALNRAVFQPTRIEGAVDPSEVLKDAIDMLRARKGEGK